MNDVRKPTPCPGEIIALRNSTSIFDFVLLFNDIQSIDDVSFFSGGIVATVMNGGIVMVMHRVGNAVQVMTQDCTIGWCLQAHISPPQDPDERRATW